MRLASLFLVAAYGCVDPQSSALELGLVVATWNAERVFDATCDSGRCGASEAEDLRTESEVDADVVRVARAARGLAADVVVLVEIENAALVSRVADAAGGLATSVTGESGPGTIDVAVLSRFPTLDVIAHRPMLDVPDRALRSTRVMLEVHLDTGGRRLVVIAAHLKSKRDDDAERRIAEAHALGAIANAARMRHPSAVVIIAGDLNDTPGSEALDALEHAAELTLLTRLLPIDDAYTFGTGSSRSLIDHVLVVPRAFVVPGEVAVVRGESGAYGGSDHAAVRVVLDVR